MEPYLPEPLPITNLDHERLIGLVGQANAALAQYDGLLQGVVNPAIFLSPLTSQEAVLSSKIEGTQATLEEVLEHEAGQNYDEQKTQDIKEIVNYRQALTFARDQLAHRPLSLSFVKDLHHILLSSVRGKDKEPGQFRMEQNWIGPVGCKIEEATFVPPSPLQLLDHLEAWERYIQESDIDPLIQTALVHAQFELLHPFKDGNGRIGRLLIPLFLYAKSVLSSPMFYLSAYLETHRDEYYSRLQSISQRNDWNEWVVFFLTAISQQSHDNSNRVKKMMALYDAMKIQIRDVTHSQFSIHVLDALFDRPIFQTSDFVRRTEIAKQTAMPILRQLRDAKILVQLREASGRRPAILAFPTLLNIAEGRSVV